MVRNTASWDRLALVYIVMSESLAPSPWPGSKLNWLSPFLAWIVETCERIEIVIVIVIVIELLLLVI